MKLESPSFTAADFKSSLDGWRQADRRRLVQRLREASAEFAELAARVTEAPPTSDGEWNPKEVLAHVAVSSEGWGAIAYLIAKGRMEQLNATDVITQRDPIGAQMLTLPAAELAARARRAQERTITFLETASPEELERRFTWERGAASAEELYRLVVCCHLEEHVEELRRRLA